MYVIPGINGHLINLNLSLIWTTTMFGFQQVSCLSSKWISTICHFKNKSYELARNGQFVNCQLHSHVYYTGNYEMVMWTHYMMLMYLCHIFVDAWSLTCTLSVLITQLDFMHFTSDNNTRWQQAWHLLTASSCINIINNTATITPASSSSSSS